MLFYAAVDNTIEQTQSIFIEMYTTPVAMKITFISLAFAVTLGIAHKFIKWFYEKDIPKLRIAGGIFAGITLLLSLGGLFASLNITSPWVYGFSAGAIVVLTFYCIGDVIIKK